MNYFLPQVYSADLKYHKTIEGRTSSISTMRLHLQSSHFGGGNPLNGQLILRCTAQIGNYYNEYTEKELSIPQKDPIPARGEWMLEGRRNYINLNDFFYSFCSHFINWHRKNSWIPVVHHASCNLCHADKQLFEIVKLSADGKSKVNLKIDKVQIYTTYYYKSMLQKYNYCELRVLSFGIIIIVIFTDSAQRKKSRMREGRVEWSIKDKFSNKFYIVSQPSKHTHTHIHTKVFNKTRNLK